jgi:Arc/MetJ-type ribon-helix-helix transcriptional regulator
MAGSTKNSVAISAKHAVAVRKAVESGAYTSKDAVVREALDLWQQTQRLDDEYLRKLWTEAAESGTAPGEWNKDQFLKWARKKMAADARDLKQISLQ